MDSTFITIYTIVAILLTVFDFNYSCRAFRMPEKMGHFFGWSALFAGVITLSYLCSVVTGSYRNMSLASSAYFISIDWLLVALTHFVFYFTRMHLRRDTRIISIAIRGYAVFDTLAMAVNSFTEIAVGYARHESSGFVYYTYQMKPLYVAHLVFTYGLVVLILGLLIYTCVNTPRRYRDQYMLLILAIAVVVLINAVFLFPNTDSMFTKVDCSFFGYSVGLMIMYWAAFSYRQNNMLKSLSMEIFQNIEQGIVLFDYLDEVIMHNRKAEQLLPDVSFDRRLARKDFLEKCAIPAEARGMDQFSTQCERTTGQGHPLRCDYSQIHDEVKGVVGNLFVFTDASDDTDILTGFQRMENFRRLAVENPGKFDHPTAVAVFDIVGLGEINRTFGREVGDQRIRSLARTIRVHMAPETCFVRGHEAHLVAVCRGCREEDIRPLAEAVAEENAGTVVFGLSSTAQEQGESRNLARAVELALHSMQVKKLLSSKSSHSQTLTSLERALQESDADTEAHVQRTQKMGECLGRRVGLNDVQLADLQLLCLLHDIGKIGIPLEILNKPGKLTDQEWMVLRTHSEKGYQIAMSSDELKAIAPMILYHHERWDGKGYPEKRAGTSIPILSRIISVVDAYDAMVNDRSYRKGMPPEQAKAEIRRCAGTQFDPRLAEEFLTMLEENPDIAVGEKTGGAEVRVFIQSASEAETQGNTFAIPYSRYLLDLDEVIVEVDERFEEITGYSAREAVGRMTQFDLIPMEDKSFYIVQVQNAFTRGNITCLKHELQRKDGSRIWVVCYGKRYYDSAEKALRSEILIFRSSGGEKEGAAS